MPEAGGRTTPQSPKLDFILTLIPPLFFFPKMLSDFTYAVFKSTCHGPRITVGYECTTDCVLTHIPPIFSVPKMLSAFYICCIYSSALVTEPE